MDNPIEDRSNADVALFINATVTQLTKGGTLDIADTMALALVQLLVWKFPKEELTVPNVLRAALRLCDKHIDAQIATRLKGD